MAQQRDYDQGSEITENTRTKNRSPLNIKTKMFEDTPVPIGFAPVTPDTSSPLG